MDREGADRSQSSGTAAAVERLASRGAGRNPGERADSGGPWVVRWRIVDLCQWIFEEFRVAVSPADSRPSAAQDGLSQALGPPPAIMPRPPALSRILKKPPHAPGRDR